MSAGPDETCPILLVDRCPVIQSGLDGILSDTPYLLVERVSSFPAARRCLTSQVVEIVLADFVFDEGTLEDLWRACRQESIPLLLFSTFRNPEFVAQAARLGICGLVDKRADANTLVSALDMARHGKQCWSRQQIRRANGSMVARSLSTRIDFPLTEREMQVLRALAEGNSNRKIAEQLGVGFETAKEHVQHLLTKLGVNDRTQAAVLAQRQGLL